MKQIVILLTGFLIFLTCCEKDSGNGLEFYLLKDYQKVASSSEIIAGSEKLDKYPIISYNEIISYDSTNHYFQIETAKAQEFNKQNWSVQGTAFALTINRSVIYSGYFMPGYSSLGLDWISIDPLSSESNIRVSLGYPGDWSQLSNRDPRNDYRIINLLKQDKKLKQ
jgi:hypothetical protein